MLPITRVCVFFFFNEKAEFAYTAAVRSFDPPPLLFPILGREAGGAKIPQ